MTLFKSPTSRRRLFRAVRTTHPSLVSQSPNVPRPEFCREGTEVYGGSPPQQLPTHPRRPSNGDPPKCQILCTPLHQDKAEKISGEASRLARELDSARSELQEAGKAAVERVGEERAAAEAAARALEDRCRLDLT